MKLKLNFRSHKINVATYTFFCLLEKTSLPISFYHSNRYYNLILSEPINSDAKTNLIKK